ncbi:MAG: hypothetical protein BGO95_10935 [Micrococcales bacterium 73-13]|nr:MAG: hypothetical protein BGO95_10935 [Micrococcales bacterium 73-13]
MPPNPVRERRSARSWIAGLSALLLGLTGIALGASPAWADLGDPGQITLNKTVDLQKAITASPGDTFTYGLLVGCDDNPCIDAVLDDQLPPEFAGFTIESVQVSPPSAPVTAALTGCTVGGAVTASCLLHADFQAPLGDLGGTPQFGIAAGVTYRVNVQLTVPLGLSPSWAYNAVPVDNTAVADAETSVTPATDSATVTVQVPVVVAVTPTKSWTPSSQLYQPGAASTFTIGARNASNLPAASLVLQDPSVATDGAATLDAGNPFNIVDFTGLCSPSTLPAGADLVQVDLYVQPTPTDPWGWVSGSPAATPTPPVVAGAVGGIRLSYTSTTGATIDAMGAASAQCVEVAQRSTNRTTGASLVGGATANNVVNATVTVPGQPPASSTADASLTVGPLNVIVTPAKTIDPSVIPAGADLAVDLSLGARNDSNGPLDTMTISEPSPATVVPGFLSADIAFDSFSSWTWPTGATAGTFVWHFDSAADQSVGLTPLGGAPTVPSPGPGDFITGFTITYTGAIAQGAVGGFVYTVNTDPGMIPDVAPWYQDFTNQIEVTGTNLAGTDVKTAQDDVRIYYPEVELAIDKKVAPSLVTPGGTVLAQLTTTTAANSARVNPTQIVVEDKWEGDGATDFWDAFRARELSFIQIPSGSTLTVRYTTDSPATDPVSWIDLVVGTTGTGGLYSNDLMALPTGSRDDITGFQFVFDNPAGFAQGTSVQPNIVYEAASTLRTGGPTTAAPDTPVPYDNVATADGEGESGGQTITADEVQDAATTQIVSYGGGTGPGPGTTLADKRWVQSDWSTDLTSLPSQSGSTARTAHGWGVTVPGYDRVVLSDPLPGAETNPAGTAFQAFDLTGIRAISFAQDPLLTWDQVTLVEIYVGGAWTPVTAPGGSWMDGTGFKGYNPSGADLAALRSATGLRITVEPNDAARAASSQPGRPAPGSGVASGAVQRPLWLQWQLRNAMRAPSGAGWVTGAVTYNTPDAGAIRNDFRVAGISGPNTYSQDRSDVVALIDNPPGVGTAKAAATTPATSPTAVRVPHYGDVDPADYPTVRFTVDAWNTAVARASYLRVTDPVPCPGAGACVTPASDRDPDVFTGNVYSPVGNPFDRFTITDVSFTVPGAVPIDPAASQVALWRYDESTHTTSVDTMTMAALDALGAVDLADVVGIGIVYQSTDPATTGGLIPTGSASSNQIRMTVDTVLRPTLRSDGSVQVAGGVSVENDVLGQSYDPVLAPSGPASTPNSTNLARVDLLSAGLDVAASKSISPSTIVETNPGVPVTVTLGASYDTSTISPERVTITDTDADFWDAFELVSLGAITRPAGADLARVDVQLDGGPTWIQGTAAATPVLPGSLSLPADLPRITGIRVVFENDPTRVFSATAPPAGWSAEALLNVQLRAGVDFPGSVANTVQARAEHTDVPPADADATASVTLSTGTPRIDVQKEAVTGGPKIVEPGVSYPWTLEFRNTGTAFYTIQDVFDDLGPSLRYDGTEPLYETNGVAMPTTGIAVTQAADDEISFGFPAGAVLAPGEWYRITVGIVLLPGLTPADQAVNAFVVDTDVTFAPGDCTNTSGNGQGVLAGVDPNQCGTTNFVSPQAGPLLFAEKEVRGEVDGTLVDGASNVTNPALPCTPASGGFYRSVCAAYTAIGATDEWRVGAANTGTIAYTSLTIVDALPTPGDRLLATGGARGSQWRPVLDLGFGIQETTVPGFPSDGVPAGTTVAYEVTTDPAPCVGLGPGSAWPTDLTCSGNGWQALSGYAGDPAELTGIRITLDFTTTVAGVLPPGGSMHFLFRTVNTPWEAGDVPTAGAVHPQLTTGPSLKAWNQTGVTASTVGGGTPLRRAPERVGVQLLTGSAAVEKTVSGVTSLAPAQVTVDAQCTVPGGAGGPAPVDLGALAVLPVPTGGIARLDGIPLGAECAFAESGALGDFGEVERTPSGPQTFSILVWGAATDPVPLLQQVSIDNRYIALAVTGLELRVPLLAAGALLGVGGILLLLGRRRRDA